MFNKGARVRCVNAKGSIFITEGQVYTIAHTSSYGVLLDTNESFTEVIGANTRYLSSRFELARDNVPEWSIK